MTRTGAFFRGIRARLTPGDTRTGALAAALGACFVDFPGAEIALDWTPGIGFEVGIAAVGAGADAGAGVGTAAIAGFPAGLVKLTAATGLATGLATGAGGFAAAAGALGLAGTAIGTGGRAAADGTVGVATV